ncbi:MAG: LPS assembly protein LptD [Woeseiaceae bacterium]|nr:LPS assembly protein LptD [Woeseiaceae bacterium]
MRSDRLILSCCLLAVSSAHADDPLACGNALATGLERDASFPTQVVDGNLPIELAAGEFEATLGENPSAQMSGGVLLRSGDKLAGADRARLDAEERALHLDGNVRYEDASTHVKSDSAEFSYESGRIQFGGAEFSLGSNNGRGAASNVLINQDGELKLDDVRYTTCPPGSDDWELQAGDIDLDTRNGVGTARNIKLKFQNVPILYAPYISFPIGDARKSGILTPEIGGSGRSGNEVRVPYYWNIAPNYDATITPRLLTDRGLQLQTEFRYLTKRDNGIVVAQYLPNDSLFNDSRFLGSLRHRTLFANGWRNRINLREVSDSQYFEDLGGSLSASSITHLDRNVRFDWQNDNMRFIGQIQDYQTLDEAILPLDEPYRRLPQLLFNGRMPKKIMGMSLALDSEVVNFDRDVGVTGWRVNVAPRVELPIEKSGWFVNPALAWDYTAYQLDNTLPGDDSEPSRSLPIASLDAGLVLERIVGQGSGSRRIQTIEPRILYVHVPHRNQGGLPQFDTIIPDLNLVQLFRKNRFLGVDRIGDTDQVSIGVTSRILDVSSGKELVTATIGQTRYLSDRQVTLPGDTPANFESSDYIAEVRFLLYENLNFDVGHQWGAGASGTTQSEARLQYRPSINKILNLSYRFRRDSLEQGDLSWSWPVSSQWNFVGRYNFSFRDNEALEQFFGLEYESCCWGLRLVSRRHISTRDGTRDSSVGLQLVLKGMTSVGTAADKLLERGILGYSANLR